MKKATITVGASTTVNLDNLDNQNRPQVLTTDLSIESSEKTDYLFSKDGTPNKDGVTTLTNGFIQGLVSTIHYAHNAGIKDSAEHLKEIISELERGFIEANVTHSPIIGGAKKRRRSFKRRYK